ncbi:MAG: tRNA (adenosine(37)-N6)-dimethylallyltransferase MiaA [Saprospiraceae bacterium]|nr:tRNA (adenosine(37)-N6)-dimethylallyltransferase MiaA [Saprospiraceae bacterium]
MKRLIVIGGATATGKTAMAIRLAQYLNTEIVSADSRQFYREMSIGTAKPHAQELAAARHHFIDRFSVGEPYSVGDFERDALQTIADIFQHSEYAILVGGSGLYLRAVCEGLDVFPEISTSTRNQVDNGYQAYGLSWLQQQILELDPAYAQQVDLQNPARLRRAIEVCLQSGTTYSSFRTQQKTSRPFQVIQILLELPRQELYLRIDERVDEMIKAGLEAEALALYASRDFPALKTVGYEEFFDYFDGKCSLEEAIELIKQHSRNYAKRQVTWFKKHGDWHAFHPSDFAGIVKLISEMG